jgi:hypothetical protein
MCVCFFVILLFFTSLRFSSFLYKSTSVLTQVGRCPMLPLGEFLKRSN